jgi:pyranose oxidase
MAFCQIILSRDLIDSVPNDPYHLGWRAKVESHHHQFPLDPLPFPFSDPDPQVYTPVSENYPWHTQIHRDAFSYGQVPATVDQRLIVDLRWFGWIRPVETNSVSFSSGVTDQFGMPQPTFHYEVPQEDARRAHAMMADMCNVASKLGGFLPGAEPKFLVPGSALHISGTTRAGTSKEDSVCDKYGRVWGTDNVVVGGCGVIPTGAACNPTLTAMCFAIAGADKMIGELREASKKLEKWVTG